MKKLLLILILIGIKEVIARDISFCDIETNEGCSNNEQCIFSQRNEIYKCIFKQDLLTSCKNKMIGSACKIENLIGKCSPNPTGGPIICRVD